MRRLLFAGSCLALLVCAPSAMTAREASPFDDPERTVVRSPGSPAGLPIPSGERVADLDASPGGGEVAVLLTSRSAARVLVWTPGGSPKQVWTSPEGISVKSVTWHPAERALFVLESGTGEHRIVCLRPGTPDWTPSVVHRSKAALRRLVVGPRPFVVGEKPGPDGDFTRRYRLFFGVSAPGGKWAIHSVTEDGDREYQVAGPAETRTALDGGEKGKSALTVASALPLSFHPAGHILLWEDGQKAFHAASYGGTNWEGTKRLFGGAVAGGTVTALPNGLGVLHWKPGAPGAEAVTRGGKETRPLAASVTFVSTPSLMPDGAGIVGVTREGESREAVRYVPVQMPLADVVNGWMFAEGDDDGALLEKEGGLFRRYGGEQLYQLYDSELYACGGYGMTTPTRPYLVTTDVLWEVWAAAYEGLFILREREEAVGAFWSFVDAAAGETARTEPGSRWARLLAAAKESRNANTGNADARLIRLHEGTAKSAALGEPFDFLELKPRGHYAGKPALRDYFSAMRYLTAAGARVADVGPLTRLSAATKAKALAWIEAYEPFLAPSRSPEALRPGTAARPWVREPGTDPVLFPLAWGFDNEALNSTVFHELWPAAEQVKGPSGPRLIPSGLDVAAAFGSQLARSLLKDETAKYPPLQGALDRLAARRPQKGEGSSLYERWLEALGAQWADEALVGAAGAREVWGDKRLQTGLASWATLRHATVLVNERSAAECGEGGFEELVMRPPRGYVEADPRTFEAIASLFDEAARVVERSRGGLAGKLPADEAMKEPLRQGLLKRLRASAEKTRGFARMARKELKGESLSPSEYEEILYVGRAAEHDLLVYKSLASEQLALSTPDPMTKVADVAGGGRVPILHAAVGAPLEFDLVVPFFGRRQVVKGSAYAYHELVSRESKAPLDDAAWRKRAAHEPLMPWIAPFLAETKLTCPARNPF